MIDLPLTGITDISALAKEDDRFTTLAEIVGEEGVWSPEAESELLSLFT